MGYTVIGNDQEVGQSLKERKTGEFLAKMGMSILLVVFIGISVALCVASFYFNELFMGFEYPFKRLGVEVLAILAVTLYAEFMYKVIFAKWACQAKVGTMFMLCIFVSFMVLGMITLAVFLWYCLVQWWTQGFFSLSFIPFVLSIVLFLVFFLRRIMDV